MATQLRLGQFLLQGVLQLCQASLQIAPEHVHLLGGRTPQLWSLDAAHDDPEQISYFLPKSEEKPKCGSGVDG